MVGAALIDNQTFVLPSPVPCQSLKARRRRLANITKQLDLCQKQMSNIDEARKRGKPPGTRSPRRSFASSLREEKKRP